MNVGVLIRDVLFPPPAPEHICDLLETALVHHNASKYHVGPAIPPAPRRVPTSGRAFPARR